MSVGPDSFEIEKGEKYEQVKPLLEKWGLNQNKAVGTIYDTKELDASQSLVYEGSWTNGYPQPEEEWTSAEKITYDVSGCCSKCVAGLVQKAPFRLKKAPVWKNKHTFELEWIYDEIFIKKATYHSLFEPLGIGYWDVLLHKGGGVIEDTLQLQLPTSSAALDLAKQPFEICTKCGIRKYINQIEGLFPNFTNEVSTLYTIQKSQEYYGSGYAANKWIIVTQELRQQMIKHGIRAHYLPMG